MKMRNGKVIIIADCGKEIVDMRRTIGLQLGLEAADKFCDKYIDTKREVVRSAVEVCAELNRADPEILTAFTQLE